MGSETGGWDFSGLEKDLLSTRSSCDGSAGVVALPLECKPGLPALGAGGQRRIEEFLCLGTQKLLFAPGQLFLPLGG